MLHSVAGSYLQRPHFNNNNQYQRNSNPQEYISTAPGNQLLHRSDQGGFSHHQRINGINGSFQNNRPSLFSCPNLFPSQHEKHHHHHYQQQQLGTVQQQSSFYGHQLVAPADQQPQLPDPLQSESLSAGFDLQYISRYNSSPANQLEDNESGCEMDVCHAKYDDDCSGSGAIDLESAGVTRGEHDNSSGSGAGSSSGVDRGGHVDGKRCFFDVAPLRPNGINGSDHQPLDAAAAVTTHFESYSIYRPSKHHQPAPRPPCSFADASTGTEPPATGHMPVLRLHHPGGHNNDGAERPSFYPDLASAEQHPHADNLRLGAHHHNISKSNSNNNQNTLGNSAEFTGCRLGEGSAVVGLSDGSANRAAEFLPLGPSAEHRLDFPWPPQEDNPTATSPLPVAGLSETLDGVFEQPSSGSSVEPLPLLGRRCDGSFPVAGGVVVPLETATVTSCCCGNKASQSHWEAAQTRRRPGSDYPSLLQLQQQQQQHAIFATDSVPEKSCSHLNISSSCGHNARRNRRRASSSVARPDVISADSGNKDNVAPGFGLGWSEPACCCCCRSTGAALMTPDGWRPPSTLPAEAASSPLATSHQDAGDNLLRSHFPTQTERQLSGPPPLQTDLDCGRQNAGVRRRLASAPDDSLELLASQSMGQASTGHLEAPGVEGSRSWEYSSVVEGLSHQNPEGSSYSPSNGPPAVALGTPVGGCCCANAAQRWRVCSHSSQTATADPQPSEGDAMPAARPGEVLAPTTVDRQHQLLVTLNSFPAVRPHHFLLCLPSDAGPRQQSWKVLAETPLAPPLSSSRTLSTDSPSLAGTAAATTVATTGGSADRVVTPTLCSSSSTTSGSGVPTIPSRQQRQQLPQNVAVLSSNCYDDTASPWVPDRSGGAVSCCWTVGLDGSDPTPEQQPPAAFTPPLPARESGGDALLDGTNDSAHNRHVQSERAATTDTAWPVEQPSGDHTLHAYRHYAVEQRAPLTQVHGDGAEAPAQPPLLTNTTKSYLYDPTMSPILGSASLVPPQGASGPAAGRAAATNAPPGGTFIYRVFSPPFPISPSECAPAPSSSTGNTTISDPIAMPRCRTDCHALPTLEKAGSKIGENRREALILLATSPHGPPSPVFPSFPGRFHAVAASQTPQQDHSVLITAADFRSRGTDSYTFFEASEAADSSIPTAVFTPVSSARNLPFESLRLHSGYCGGSSCGMSTASQQQHHARLMAQSNLALPNTQPTQQPLLPGSFGYGEDPPGEATNRYLAHLLPAGILSPIGFRCSSAASSSIVSFSNTSAPDKATPPRGRVVADIVRSLDPAAAPVPGTPILQNRLPPHLQGTASCSRHFAFEPSVALAAASALASPCATERSLAAPQSPQQVARPLRSSYQNSGEVPAGSEPNTTTFDGNQSSDENNQEALNEKDTLNSTNSGAVNSRNSEYHTPCDSIASGISAKHGVSGTGESDSLARSKWNSDRTANDVQTTNVIASSEERGSEYRCLGDCNPENYSHERPTAADLCRTVSFPAERIDSSDSSNGSSRSVAASTNNVSRSTGSGSSGKI